MKDFFRVAVVAALCVSAVNSAMAQGSADKVVETEVIRRAFDVDTSGLYGPMDATRLGHGAAAITYGGMAAIGCGGDSALDKIARPLLTMESVVAVSGMKFNPADDLAAVVGGIEGVTGILLFFEARQSARKGDSILAPVCDVAAGIGLIYFGARHGLSSDFVKGLVAGLGIPSLSNQVMNEAETVFLESQDN